MTRRGTVVAVDDDELVLEFLRQVLTQDGFEVSCFTDGNRALAHCEESEPALVISDVLMPELDGLELQAAYARLFPSRLTPFIFLSSLQDTHTVVTGLESGADDYLTKPVDPEILTAKVRAVVRRAHRVRGTSFRGDLGQMALPALLKFCETKGLTGYLDVFSGDSVTTLRFRGGQVDEADADRHLERLCELASGPFVVHSSPVDFGELSPRRFRITSPASSQAPLGRVSGIRLNQKLFQLQTEVTGEVQQFVVSVVTVDGRTVWKRSERVPDEATTQEIQGQIDQQHDALESQVEQRMAEELAKHKTTAEDRRARFHQLFDQGYECYRAHDYVGAIAHWQQAHALDPTNHTVLVNLKVVMDKLKRDSISPKPA